MAAAVKAKMIVDKSFRIAEVDNRIYGSFVEHLGRAGYGGCSGRTHSAIYERGCRNDGNE
ncbi:alpha-N-arabinofuranosidase, partial [Bacillus cereus]|nr:alpha-N-arabinofuranosidase [Bacillus cereus]